MKNVKAWLKKVLSWAGENLVGLVILFLVLVILILISLGRQKPAIVQAPSSHFAGGALGKISVAGHDANMVCPSTPSEIFRPQIGEEFKIVDVNTVKGKVESKCFICAKSVEAPPRKICIVTRVWNEYLPRLVPDAVMTIGDPSLLMFKGTYKNGAYALFVVEGGRLEIY